MLGKNQQRNRDVFHGVVMKIVKAISTYHQTRLIMSAIAGDANNSTNAKTRSG